MESSGVDPGELHQEQGSAAMFRYDLSSFERPFRPNGRSFGPLRTSKEVDRSEETEGDLGCGVDS